MTTKEHDTDPSTPSARRSAPPQRATDGTDPGVGPPMGAPLHKTTPLNIVVPAPGLPSIDVTPVVANPAGQKKDSVEILLDGMAGPRPGRVRTTPQSGGEASAAYHAEHDLHPGQSLPEDPPKVLVERPPTPRAIPVSAVARRSAPPSASLRATDPTVITRDDLRRRIVVAFVAGLIVVLGLFVVLRLTSGRGDEGAPLPPGALRATAAPEGPGAPSAAHAVPGSPSAAPGPATASGELTGASEAPPSASGAPTTPSAASSASVVTGAASGAPEKAPGRRRHPARAVPSTSQSSAAPSAAPVDLGEFKTKF